MRACASIYSLFSAVAIGKSSTKHLVVDISAHGLGHFAQVAAVLNELEKNINDDSNIQLTIRSMTTLTTLRERIHLPFNCIAYSQDNGMIMHDALGVDTEASMDWYRNFHQNYDERVDMACRDLELLNADLILSDVPYVSLDAASKLGIPSIAMCSLNWADIFESYCGKFTDAMKIHSEILNAYSKASLFLRPIPSMPMSQLTNTITIPPVVSLGNRQPKLLRQAISKEDDENAQFILVGIGGFDIEGFSLRNWPSLPNVNWIFPDSILLKNNGKDDFDHNSRSDLIPQSKFNHMRYIDLLASCNLLLTKTGYGTQTEAVANQIPVICINRHDWPEHIYLSDWHSSNGEVQFVDFEYIGRKNFAIMVKNMLRQKWTFQPISTDGASMASLIVIDKLGIPRSTQ